MNILALRNMNDEHDFATCSVLDTGVQKSRWGQRKGMIVKPNRERKKKWITNSYCNTEKGRDGEEAKEQEMNLDRGPTFCLFRAMILPAPFQSLAFTPCWYTPSSNATSPLPHGRDVNIDDNQKLFCWSELDNHKIKSFISCVAGYYLTLQSIAAFHSVDVIFPTTFCGCCGRCYQMRAVLSDAIRCYQVRAAGRCSI